MRTDGAEKGKGLFYFSWCEIIKQQLDIMGQICSQSCVRHVVKLQVHKHTFLFENQVFIIHFNCPWVEFTWESSSSWMIPPWGCGIPIHHRLYILQGAGNTDVPCSWGARRRSSNPPWHCRSKCHDSGSDHTRWGSHPWTPLCVPSGRAYCISSSCRILYTVCERNQNIIIMLFL